MGLFSGIANAVGGFIGGAANAFTGGMIGDYFNRKAEKRQWNRDITMWNMQNEYNSPSAQMERLRQAGLNPQLALGDVNSVAKAQLGGSASQSSNSSVGTVDLIKNPLALAQFNLNKKQAEANIELTKEKAKTESDTQRQLLASSELLQAQKDIERWKLDTGIVGNDSLSNLFRSILGAGNKINDKLKLTNYLNKFIK